MKRTQMVLTVLGMTTAALPAFANEPTAQTPQTTQTTVQAQAPARGAGVHDGFYLRLATGFGAYNEGIRRAGQDRETRVNGIATVGELAIGGAIRPGFILGGGVWSSTVLASDRTVRGTTPPAEVLDTRGEFSLIGPFVDYYPDATQGLHFQGAIGLANVRGFGNGDDDPVALGGGLMLGIGYEWWVSEEWSLGVLGRLAVGAATGTDNTDKRWYHTVGATPSALFTATYN